MPKQATHASPEPTRPGSTARKYTGNGLCWMHGEITRAAATWEVSTKHRDGTCHMLLCDYHYRQVRDETHPKEIE